MPATSYRSGDVTAISPGFHGRSLLTPPARPAHPPAPAGRRRRTGRVDGAEPRPRRYRHDGRRPAAIAFVIGALRKPARDRRHDPCYKLMATFHKMNDEPGTEIVRCFDRGRAEHVSTQGQPDQRHSIAR